MIEIGGKGGNRTLDPGIMRAGRAHSSTWNNDLRMGCAGFRSPTYVLAGLAPAESRHTVDLVSIPSHSPQTASLCLSQSVDP